MLLQKGISKVIASIILLLGLNISLYANVLEDYIEKEDGFFSYALTETSDETLQTYRAHILALTSQKWLDDSKIDRPVWQHQLTVYVPKTLLSIPNTAIMVIEGGSTTSSIKSDETLGLLASLYNTVVVSVRQIPNQPFSFTGTGPMKEDDLVSYSFKQFIETEVDEYPIYLPMVKSVVKAMDAAQAFLKEQEGIDIDHFIPIGASKRGWTTWLTAAVDDRVIGFIAGAIDTMNIDESLKQHFESLGDYYDRLKTYTDKGLACDFFTPRGQELLSIVDAYEYKDRYEGKPFLLINGANDQFFTNNSSQVFFKDMPNNKYLHYIPNTDHGLNDKAYFDAMTFAKKVMKSNKSGKKIKLSDIFWEMDEATNTLTVYSSKLPLIAKFWTAKSDTHDFRFETVGEESFKSKLVTFFDFKRVSIDPDGDGIKQKYYRIKRKLETPESGYQANYFTLNFGLFNDFSTEVFVTPRALPFAGQQCAK